MGEGAVQLRPFIRGENLSNGFVRIRPALEEIFGNVFRMDLDKAREIAIEVAYGTANKHVKGIFRRRKSEIKVFFEEAKEDAARRSLSLICEFPYKGFDRPEQYLRYSIKFPLKGESDVEKAVTIINLEEIRDKHPHKECQEACIELTLIHEILHHLGGFNDFCQKNGKVYSLKWLDEGTTEMIAREALKKRFPEIATDVECDTYNAEMSLAGRMAKLIEREEDGKELAGIYFCGDFITLVKKMRDAGAAENEIEAVFELGDKVSDEDPQVRESACNDLSTLLDALIRRKHRKQGASYTEGETTEIGGCALEAHRQNARKALGEANLNDQTSLKQSVNCLWNYIFARYGNHSFDREAAIKNLPGIELTVGKDFFERVGNEEKFAHGVYIPRTHSILLNRQSINEIEKKRAVLLLVHETLHAACFAGKKGPDLENGFLYDLSEAVTNSLASECLQDLFPEWTPDARMRNFHFLGQRLMEGLGRAKICRWYFGDDYRLIYDILGERYGFGSEIILEAGERIGDFSPTMMAAVLSNMEDKRETLAIRAATPDYREFRNAFDRRPLETVYRILESSAPSLTPYQRAITAGSIMYASIKSEAISNPELSAYEMAMKIAENPLESGKLREEFTLPLLERVGKSGNILPSLREGYVADEAILNCLINGQIPTDSAVEQKIQKLSEGAAQYGREEQLGNALVAIRDDIVKLGHNNLIRANDARALKSTEVDLAYPDGRIITDPAVIEPIMPYVNRILSSGAEPMVIDMGSGLVAVPVPAGTAKEELHGISDAVFASYEYHMQRMGIDSFSAQVAADAIASSEDIFRAIGATAEQIAGKERGIENFRIIRPMARPGPKTIETMYAIAVLSQECIPGRSYLYDAALKNG